MIPAPHRTVALSVVKHDYLPLAVAAHPQFELIGVADQAECPPWVHQRNQTFADQLGIPYRKGVTEALRDWNASVAVVSSEAERHCELGRYAAQAGLHVILDKPLSNRLSECDSLVDAVQQSGVRSLVWNRNYLPALLQAKKTIDDLELGRLLAVHCDFFFSKDAGPRKGSRQPGDPPINWLERQREAHADGSDGGVGVEPLGELHIEGLYPLAYLRMLTGARVRQVFAQTAIRFHQANEDNQVEDLASVTLELSNGVKGSVCVGRIGADSHPDIGEIKLHLIGTRGALAVAEARPEISVYYHGQPAGEFKNRRIGNQNDFLLMDDFARAIAEGTPTSLDALEARNIMATVQAALESSRNRQLTKVSNRDL